MPSIKEKPWIGWKKKKKAQNFVSNLLYYSAPPLEKALHNSSLPYENWQEEIVKSPRHSHCICNGLCHIPINQMTTVNESMIYMGLDSFKLHLI